MQLARKLLGLCLSLRRRRLHARVPTSLVADWHLFGSALRHRSETADVSPNGASLETVKPLPVGSPVVVALATPRGPVEVHARVAWTGPAKMGVRFTRPNGTLAD